MLPLKYLQTDKEIRIRTFTVILISSITKAYFIRPSISPTWILQKLVHVRSNRCTFLWVVNASLSARSSGSEGSLLKSWHFSESIQIKFLKKTFHTFSLKNSPRSSPSQYFLLKHFLIDYNMLSTVTPPNALTLVTFSQHPELAKKMLALPVFSWEEIWGIYLVLPSSVMFLEPFLPLLMLWQHHQMVPLSCPGGPGEGQPEHSTRFFESETEFSADGSLSFSLVSVCLEVISAMRLSSPRQLANKIKQICGRCSKIIMASMCHCTDVTVWCPGPGWLQQPKYMLLTCNYCWSCTEPLI